LAQVIDEALWLLTKAEDRVKQAHPQPFSIPDFLAPIMKIG